MKNTNSKEFKAKVFGHFSDILSGEDMDLSLETDLDKALYVKSRIEGEYEHVIRQKGIYKAVAEWLSGLAINIDYSYHDIIKRAESWHECELNEKQADMVCERWFDFMGLKLIQYCEKQGVNLRY